MTSSHSAINTFLLSVLVLLQPFSPKLVLAVEDVLTPLMAVQEALSNNPEIKAARAAVLAKEAVSRSSGYPEDPAIKVELEDLPKDEPLNISPDNAMMTRYTLSQGIPFPGKLSLREKISLKGVSRASSLLKAREAELRAEVKDAYYEYAFLTEAIGITGEIKEILSLMAKVAEARYGTGQAAQQDVVRAQLERTMLTNEVITLEAQREISAARLKSLLARPQGSPLQDPAPIPRERVQIKADELAMMASESSPEIKAMEHELQGAELSVELMRKDYYPDFMVGVAPVERDGRFESFDLMFQMNIPLWRSKYSGRVGEAAAEADVMRARLSSEKNDRAFMVKEAGVRVEAAVRSWTLYETSLIPQAELSLESALKNYQAGRTDLLTLLDSGRALRRVKIEHLGSIRDYWKMLSALEKAVGKELFTK